MLHDRITKPIFLLKLLFFCDSLTTASRFSYGHSGIISRGHILAYEISHRWAFKEFSIALDKITKSTMVEITAPEFIIDYINQIEDNVLVRPGNFKYESTISLNPSETRVDYVNRIMDLIIGAGLSRKDWDYTWQPTGDNMIMELLCDDVTLMTLLKLSS